MPKKMKHATHSSRHSRRSREDLAIQSKSSDKYKKMFLLSSLFNGFVPVNDSENSA